MRILKGIGLRQENENRINQLKKSALEEINGKMVLTFLELRLFLHPPRRCGPPKSDTS
jgi:hypothetical protein